MPSAVTIPDLRTFDFIVLGHFWRSVVDLANKFSGSQGNDAPEIHWVTSIFFLAFLTNCKVSTHTLVKSSVRVFVKAVTS